MDEFVRLLNNASFYLFMTEEEIEAFNSSPSVIAMLDDLRRLSNQASEDGERSIGDKFAEGSLHVWNAHNAESIDRITEYIATGDAIAPQFIIGFISLWANSEIDHPIIDKLVKHSIKNDLLKYPFSTTVNEYNSLTKYKKPNHAPKKNPLLYLKALMHFFEIRTISGTAKALGVDRKVVKDHLSKIVNGEVEYTVFIDENFEHYELIKKTYDRWLACDLAPREPTGTPHDKMLSLMMLSYQ